MMAALTFTISFLMLLQFFVAYSHSLIQEARGHQLSAQVCELSGVAADRVRGDHFKRLLELIAICPQPGNDTNRVLAVSIYFKLLGVCRALLGWVLPTAAFWLESERSGCAYLAAVVLDRRIAYNRILSEQKAESCY